MMPSLELLPQHPQISTLSALVDRIRLQSEVTAIWLGGSYATGKADRYSDVDLRIAVEADAFQEWMTADLPALFEDPCPGSITMSFSPESVLHHVVLSSGELFDLYVQTSPPAGVEDPIIILETRYDSLQEDILNKRHAEVTEQASVTSEELERVVRGFWVNTHKHRKVLDRNLDLLAQVGIGMDRDVLRRLWYIKLTGLDEPRRKTIHSLTDQMRVVSAGISELALDVLGMPLRSRNEIVEGIEAIWDEVSAVGNLLAHEHGFSYPWELEAVVRNCWKIWREE